MFGPPKCYTRPFCQLKTGDGTAIAYDYYRLTKSYIDKEKDKRVYSKDEANTVSTYGNQDAVRYGCLGGGGIFTGILIAIAQKWE